MSARRRFLCVAWATGGVVLLLTSLAWGDSAALQVAMVLVPAGDFQMGSHPGEIGRLTDEDHHRVTITRPFHLGRTEVTQSLWRATMGTDPSTFTGCDDCPVESVSWEEAVRFCNTLSMRAGLAPAYTISDTLVSWEREAPGYRLPTEAEWEYACRAGGREAFHTGRCLAPELANYNAYAPRAGCSDGMNRGEPIEAGSFPPNAWGLCDMHGNVREWCWDWYAPYPSAEERDQVGPTRGERRVMRGGSWADSDSGCRAARREASHPARRRDVLGLRLARNAAGDRR